MNLSVEEAAERLRVSPSMIYTWCRERMLTCLRLGRPGKRGKIVIPESALVEFEDRHKQVAELPAPAMKLKHIRL
jgi:excisionase family DNA binding protein